MNHSLGRMEMMQLFRNRAGFAVRALSLTIGVAMLLGFAACAKKEQPAPTTQAEPQTFASPEAAGKALMEGAKAQNQDMMLSIFGPGSKDLIYSGDAAEDKTSMEGFVQAYGVMNRWRTLPDGSELLLVGADNQAFPIPLKKNASGQWYFDAAAGKDEVLARRIGRNEIIAIDVCAALADAQAEYLAQKHDGVKQYAQKFLSDPGKQNGLYWESAEGQPRSPVGPLVAFATEEGYSIK